MVSNVCVKMGLHIRALPGVYLYKIYAYIKKWIAVLLSVRLSTTARHPSKYTLTPKSSALEGKFTAHLGMLGFFSIKK